jgi:MFS family permease
MLSLAALLMSITLVQLSSGGIGPLDALSGLASGFTAAEVGLLGSAHFAGFFAGCWAAPRLMGSVGHSRAFGAFTALGAIGVIAHMLLVDPLVWAGLRVLSGFAIAGCYTVIEAWLQARLENRTRGRVLGIYRMVDLGAGFLGQLMIGFLEPATYASYNILGILCCATMFPLLLTTAQPPVMVAAPRLRPLAAIRLSPLAAAGVVTAGVVASAYRMVGPLYGAEMGLGRGQIGWFLAVGVLGGALAQLPAGWLADKMDRRRVLAMASALGVAVCLAAALLRPGEAGQVGAGPVLLAAFAFGFATYPLYSISAAHANDFARPEEMAELSAALLFLWGVGAIASPLIVSTLIDAFGPGVMWLYMAAAHAALLAFGLVRMRARPVPPDRTGYAYLPRTSFLLGWLMGRR